jgi:carboxylate-amine ligase
MDVCLDPGMIYFDARLSRHAPTVEVRVADVCLMPHDAGALAALVRALVDTAAWEWRAGLPASGIPTSLLRLASWRASRFGVAERLMDPASGSLRPAADVVRSLLRHVEHGFCDSAERDEVRRRVTDVLRRGSGAAQQRFAMNRRGEPADLINYALRQTHASGVPPAADEVPVLEAVPAHHS